MKYDDVRNILPQKEPFMFVDGIKYFDENSKSLIAYKTFRNDEYFFKGHFPGDPLVPGVIIIEALSQSCILCGYYTSNSAIEEDIDFEHLIYDIKIKFRNKCFPDEEIYLQSDLIDVIQNISTFKVKAINKENKIIASGEIKGIAKYKINERVKPKTYDVGKFKF
jgi:3-hydroxyacyl-[acyl-carrier-protein] dehydratase